MAKIGYGSKIEIGRGATPTWTTLARVKDIPFPESTVDEIDVTSMDSPNATKEFIPGLVDNGEMSFELDWIPESPTHVLLKSLKNSRELVQIRITVPNELTPAEPYIETYAGWCKGYARTSAVQSQMTATATFRINAEIVE